MLCCLLELLFTRIEDNKVNKIGARLGFAYGGEYWTRAAIRNWLPDQPEMEKCRAFYAL